ncbi:MAG: hypothetical protein CL908_21920 [Deltaproteobacteria bacterium]|nr:hypothetical protein [Deltaproteobacteria bacterium]
MIQLAETDDPTPSAPGRPGGAILFVTDRRFWRRSIGSEQRIASLVAHLALSGRRVVVAYVGRIARREREGLKEFTTSLPGLIVLGRGGSTRALARSALGSLRSRLRLGLSNNRPPEAPPIAGRSSPQRRTFVTEMIREHRPAVVIVEFLRLTYTVFPRNDDASSVPRYLIDTHDVLHQRADRYRAEGAGVTHEIEASEEARALATYDAILAIQAKEAELIRGLLPERPVIVVPHGLQIPKLPALAAPPNRPTRIGFLGGRDEANLRALDWFVEEVWPEIRSEFENRVELRIAGQVCRVWDRLVEGATRVGVVDSIDAFWPSVDLAINPVRMGSGLKIKNVEALAYGRALLTTTIGAEGLEQASPNGLRVADSAADLISILSDWLADPASAAATGLRGRLHAECHFSSATAFAALDACLAETSDTRSEEPSEVDLP